MSRRARSWIVLAVVASGLLGVQKQTLACQHGSRTADRAADPDTAGLTLVGAVEAALASYPSLKAAHASVVSSGAAAGRAAAARWPDLSLRASVTQYEEPMIVQPIHGFEPGATPPFDETLVEAGAYLEYTLWDFGARSARIRRARRSTAAARAARAGTEQELVARVAATYLDLLGQRGVLDAHDRRIRALEEERERVRRMREVGRAARVELLRVEAALASARSDREEVAAGLRVATRELRRLTGLPADRVEPGTLADLASGDSGPPPLEALVPRARRESPAVREARRRQEAAGAGLDLARTRRWPALELGGGWVDRGSADGHFRAEWSVGVGFSVPLFTGGRVSGAIEEARAEATGAEHRTRLVEKAVERAVDEAFASWREKTVRVESLRRAVESQREVVRIEKLRLETGTGTQTDYLDAEADLLSARAQRARTRYAALRARMELARATGALDRGWIERNLEVVR